jgi:hypothetical protein
MNAISSAAPCHVRYPDGTTYDVICWTIGPISGQPIPWIVKSTGAMVPVTETLRGSGYLLANGPAPKAGR